MSDEYLRIIEALKFALIEAPILPYPDVDSTFILIFRFVYCHKTHSDTYRLY